MEKIVVAILSVSSESCTDSFSNNITKQSSKLTCRFVKLTRSDLQSFKPQEKYDAVILLHSVLQGYNSITDVRSAKYDKLLPLLKQTYGPNRVAVVVHSIFGHNAGTKRALMMIFRQAQKTTFKCSNYIIQCNNLSKIENKDVEELIEFLEQVPDHALPARETETSHLQTNNTTEIKSEAGTASFNRNRNVGGSTTAEKGVISKKGDMLESDPKTRDTCSTESFGVHSQRDKESSFGSGSNLGQKTVIEGGSSSGSGCHSLEAKSKKDKGSSHDSGSKLNRQEAKSKVKHSGHKDDHSSEISLLSKGINLAHPEALVILSNSSNSQELEKDIRACFKGKVFMRIGNRKMLRDYWSKLEAILVNVGDRGHICEKKFLIAVKSSKNGKGSKDEIVEWQKIDEGADDVDGQHLIGCAVFAFSESHDLQDNTSGITDVINFLQMNQGRYPVAAITHVDVANEANVEGLSTYLRTTDVSEFFKVVNLTKEQPQLDEALRIPLNLLNLCMAEEQHIKIGKPKVKEQEEKLREQERRATKKRQAAETTSMDSQDKLQQEQRVKAQERESMLALEQERLKARERERVERDRVRAQERERVKAQERESMLARERDRVAAQRRESMKAQMLLESEAALARERVAAKERERVMAQVRESMAVEEGISIKDKEQDEMKIAQERQRVKDLEDTIKRMAEEDLKIKERKKEEQKLLEQERRATKERQAAEATIKDFHDRMPLEQLNHGTERDRVKARERESMLARERDMVKAQERERVRAQERESIAFQKGRIEAQMEVGLTAIAETLTRVERDGQNESKRRYEADRNKINCTIQ